MNAFAVTSGWQVSAASDLTTGVDSPGVIGRYSSEQAIQAILSGTGRSYRVDGVQMITIERASSASALPAAADSSSALRQEQPEQKSEKPIKVPEIVVKDVRHSDQDTTSYTAERAIQPRAPTRR